MRVPNRYQIFDAEVIISHKDEERLRVHLSNWNRLHEIMLLGINIPDLQRLVIMELLGNGRSRILTRLLGRLTKLQRAEVQQKVNQLLT
jgi:hypothetical protein